MNILRIHRRASGRTQNIVAFAWEEYRNFRQFGGRWDSLRATFWTLQGMWR